ncbi:hypothetical protein LSH36_34g01067 [Paralvinella palmiformis]|uniref:FAM234A/B beta-propeller domain-containing protein n=1 Tax=Paralvinella palmiformis TaxID=53620 RepID=A0AAD9K8C2_9ANNE|nr:hypothetical protein LSH36_34g01067 [Paralvinella palmiformis]
MRSFMCKVPNLCIQRHSMKDLTKTLVIMKKKKDDVLFIQDGGASKQNGFSQPGNEANKELLSNGKNSEKIELDDLGIQHARIRKASEVEVRTLRYRSLTLTRMICFVLTLLLAVGFVIGLVVVLPHLKASVSSQRHYPQTKEWNITYPEYATESLVQLFDVDEDGRLDIIFSIVPGSSMGKSEPSRSNEDQYCKERGFTTSPCVAEVKAIRGYDGALIWQFYAHSSIFEMNCGNIDINKDGKMDCIASGRLATVVAFDPREGHVFWRGDQSQMEEIWNIYNVLIIPDMNQDGVLDLVVAHGGDPTFPPEVTDRKAGRLILLDGATGSAIGKRYLKIPDDKETYMSPIMHVRKDGSEYIIFGHGGETVPGIVQF